MTVLLGVLAKRRKLMTPEQVQGLQQFVLKFGLPCVIFTSCLTANMGMESLSSMGLVLLFVLLYYYLQKHHIQNEALIQPGHRKSV